MEDSAQEISATKRSNGPIVITAIVIAALVLVSIGILLNSDRDFVLTGDSVKNVMYGRGFKLEETTNLANLSKISKAKWGGEELKDAVRWIYKKGNETMIIRQREFNSPDATALRLVGSINNDNMHFTEKESLGEASLSGLFFNDMYQSGLVFLIRDGNRLIEIAYSNDGFDYDPANIKEDRTMLRSVIKKLFGLWF